MGKPTDNINYKIIGTLKTRTIKDFLVDNTRDSEDFKQLKNLLGKIYNVISINYVEGDRKNRIYVVDQYIDKEEKQFLFIHQFHLEWYHPKEEKDVKNDSEN